MVSTNENTGDYQVERNTCLLFQSFRGSNPNGFGHGGYTSFMGAHNGPAAPIPTLPAASTLDRSIAGPINGRQPLFHAPPHPSYRENENGIHQQKWAYEYLQQSNPASQHDYSSYKPSLAPVNSHAMQGVSPGLVNGAYNSPRLPDLSRGFSTPEQLARLPEHPVEMSQWMGTHQLSGVGFHDVDQVLDQISGELDNLAVDAEPNRQIQPAVEQRGTVNTEGLENQARDTAVTETPSSTANGPTPVSDLARKILQAVEHEDDEKWKESLFLALMRDFRDGRKDVTENTIEVVSSA